MMLQCCNRRGLKPHYTSLRMLLFVIIKCSEYMILNPRQECSEYMILKPTRLTSSPPATRIGSLRLC